MDQATANNTFVRFGKTKERKLPKCPKCMEPYMGDGIALCVECAAAERREWGRKQIKDLEE
jgi:hypothetical protein